MLAVLATHPVQYQAPVYRCLQEQCAVPVTVIYGSDFSINEYLDREFGERFAWDRDLLSGYDSRFLSQVSKGGATSVEEVSADGLDKLLHQVSPRAVLSVGYGHRFHRHGFRAARRQGTPILFRAETSDADRQRGFARRIARDTGLRAFYRRCAKLLYIGSESHQHFKRLGVPEDKLIFSPYCIDLNAFRWDESARSQLRACTRELLGIEAHRKVILFSGKLSKRKGPDLLIEAIKTLAPDRRSEIAVVFLGNGDLRLRLELMAQEPPAVRAVFAGFKNQSELSPYFHAADLLVLPSRHSETWGLVVNEALHHGLPCVVSESVGCARDLVEANVSGEVFATDSAKSLAAAIGRAVERVDDRESRERCRLKVSTYSVQRAAAGIADAYQAVTRMDFASV